MGWAAEQQQQQHSHNQRPHYHSHRRASSSSSSTTSTTVPLPTAAGYPSSYAPGGGVKGDVARWLGVLRESTAMTVDGGRHNSRLVLLLAAATTLAGSWIFVSLAGLLEVEDLEEDAKDNALQAAVIGARIWFLSSTVAGFVGARGVLQAHLPSLRAFAVHSVIDTAFAGLTTFIIALVAFSPSVSSKFGHAVCEHISRGDAWGIVYSPGSGLEACEERWSYGIAPILLLVAGIALFLRLKTAAYIYGFYQEQATESARTSIESPLDSQGGPPKLRDGSFHPYGAGAGGSLPLRIRTNTNASAISLASTSSSSSSGTSGTAKKRTSRSSSTSTLRPGTARRIMLLPVDYKPSPDMQVTPPTPASTSSSSASTAAIKMAPSSSSDSLDTIKAPMSTSAPTPSSLLERNRKRAMSQGAYQSSRENVVVYAPILMSIEEAQKLGGREAVIASGLSSSSPAGSGPASTASPRLRQASPTSTIGGRKLVTTPPLLGNSTTIREEPTAISPSSQPHLSSTNVYRSTYSKPLANPFGSIKGYRDNTEMADLHHAKTQ